MDRFCPTENVSKKLVHPLKWTTFFRQKKSKKKNDRTIRPFRPILIPSASRFGTSWVLPILDPSGYRFGNALVSSGKPCAGVAKLKSGYLGLTAHAL